MIPILSGEGSTLGRIVYSEYAHTSLYYILVSLGEECPELLVQNPSQFLHLSSVIIDSQLVGSSYFFSALEEFERYAEETGRKGVTSIVPIRQVRGYEEQGYKMLSYLTSVDEYIMIKQ